MNSAVERTSLKIDVGDLPLGEDWPPTSRGGARHKEKDPARGGGHKPNVKCMAEINGNSPTVRERVLDQEHKRFTPKGRGPMPRTGVLQQRQEPYTKGRRPIPKAGA